MTLAPEREPSLDAFRSGTNWSREQVMLAFRFYCQTPFGQLHGRNKKVIELAALIGRTPGALAMKCSNIASLDPAIVASGRVGLVGASQLDKDIWAEFHADWGRLAVECERLYQFLLHARGLQPSGMDEPESTIEPSDFGGEMREVIARQRVGQDFFRKSVLSGYGGRCCISGVSDPRLLVASHIVPWATDTANRLNPGNGLCLSALHDKAFDSLLFSVSDDYRIVLSPTLRATKDTFLREVFWPTEDRPITLPERFVPEAAFLAQHRGRMLGRST